VLKKNSKIGYLYACEDSGESHTYHEHEQKTPVQVLVPLCVEYREKDQARAANHGTKHSQYAKVFFPTAHGRN
jgi:hypothetical protein